ncbi:MAG: EamA family transporter [Bryobacteraceae bacterium]
MSERREVARDNYLAKISGRRRDRHGDPMSHLRRIFWSVFVFAFSLAAQETHDHSAPEKLGSVSFPISCLPAVQQEFNRGVALLHSFSYSAAERAFRRVAESDPQCAMAHWGVAMTHFHQLWEPPLSPVTIPIARQEIQRARAIATGSERERKFINALELIYQADSVAPYPKRVSEYERAMCDLAKDEVKDAEAQVFCALALLGSASPMDKSHAKQKRAADLLEPLSRVYPQQPGISHYLIHAYDNAELAPRGLVAARAYSKIAASAPHALHMPSHIFTRLGLWEDSIASNIAAKEAARQQRDTGEELHAMDYLVYAYLQTGRDKEAADVVQQLGHIQKQNFHEFKVAYAATAMPVRYAVERSQWGDAANIVSPPGAPPQVVAIAVWARGLGLVRSGRRAEAHAEIDKLRQIEVQLRTSGNEYWATQTSILMREVMAWSAQAAHEREEALVVLRQAADDEDAIEKLPISPGPILPAREQLGYLLLEQNQPDLALKEFETSLVFTPGRRGALNGASHAAELCRHRSRAIDAPQPTPAIYQTEEMTWLTWSLLSALFAAATAILAKLGVEGIDANLATAVRTTVVVLFTWLIASVARQPGTFQTLSTKTWLFLVLSGFATGLSWLCYFRALQVGPASRVAPIDKVSVALVIIFGAMFLGEKLTWGKVLGGALMVAGAIAIALE